jgi:hypothetical protein
LWHAGRSKPQHERQRTGRTRTRDAKPRDPKRKGIARRTSVKRSDGAPDDQLRKGVAVITTLKSSHDALVERESRIELPRDIVKRRATDPASEAGDDKRDKNEDDQEAHLRPAFDYRK